MDRQNFLFKSTEVTTTSSFNSNQFKNWFHRLSKSPAIPFSQVSADSFRFNSQECARSLYTFIAFRPIDMFCTAFSHAKPPRNIHVAREVTLSLF